MMIGILKYYSNIQMALVRILLCILIDILKYPDSYGNEIMIDMLKYPDVLDKNTIMYVN